MCKYPPLLVKISTPLELRYTPLRNVVLDTHLPFLTRGYNFPYVSVLILDLKYTIYDFFCMQQADYLLTLQGHN